MSKQGRGGEMMVGEDIWEERVRKGGEGRVE